MDEDDSFEEDFEGAYLQADAGKKCTVYLVDGSPKMFEIPEDDDQETDCAFRRALKATFDEIFVSNCASFFKKKLLVYIFALSGTEKK